MSTVNETSHRGERIVVYVLIGVIFVMMMVVGAILFDAGSDDDEAVAADKANQLIAALEEAGVQNVPSHEQVVNSLGADGGAVCTNADSALSRATYYSQLVNGAAGPGTRPVIVDRRVVQGQALIMSVYCPDQLAAVKAWLDDLKVAVVVKQ